MRSTGSTQRRTQVNAWLRRPNTQSAVLKKIQTITKELETLQAEMHGELADPGRGKTGRLFEDNATMETVNRFKVELDQLRRILWFYTEEAVRKTGSVTEQEKQSRQPEEVGTFVRAISPKTRAFQPDNLQTTNLKTSHPKTGNPAYTVESVSFFDRLDNVIDTYMQGKKPVSRETKANARRETKAFS